MRSLIFVLLAFPVSGFPIINPVHTLYKGVVKQFETALDLRQISDPYDNCLITDKQKHIGNAFIYESKRPNFRRISSVELHRNGIYTFSCFSSSYNFTPHFVISLHSLGKVVLCLLDVQPRVDVLTNPVYVKRYYPEFQKLKRNAQLQTALQPLSITNEYIAATRSFIALDCTVNFDVLDELKPHIEAYANAYTKSIEKSVTLSDVDYIAHRERDRAIQKLQMLNAPGRKIMTSIYSKTIVDKIDYYTYGYYAL